MSPLHRAARRYVAAFALVELMIALVIGGLTVVVALEVFVRGRDMYRVGERVARLQEQGRTAFATIEPDVEMAGFYGFTQLAGTVRLVRGGNPDVVVAPAQLLRQFPAQAGDALPAAVGWLPSGAHSCGVNFAVDVSTTVQGSNNRFALGRAPVAACNPYQGRAAIGADTLTLRRVETQASSAEANRLQIYASRNTSRSAQYLFSDGKAPGPVDESHEVHNLVVRSYYIARDSVGQRDFPALRVKSLTRSGTGVVFDEDEVMVGVEDLQVQFGICTDGSGRATHYVNPDSPELFTAQVVSVRAWLRLRADQPEPTFVDTRTYRYSNVEYTPVGAEQNFRRVLMSRTITLRNARWR